MIEVIQLGKLPDPLPFRGTCLNCKTVVKCSKEDGKYTSDQRDGAFVEITCPLCSRQMWCYK